MANVKISNLPAASTPLAGTEVLPIVQSSATVKATVANVQTATYSGGTANGVAYLNGSKVLTTGSALVFDGSNLGVGVTPSAWGSINALQIKTGISLWSVTGTGYYSNNVYFDGANRKYIYTGGASEYVQDAGVHSWKYAASGTAGTNITFTQAMTLDASGNLGVGATSPAKKLDVYLGTTGTVGQYLRNTTVNLLSQIDGTSSAQFGTETSHPLLFLTGNIERMRLDTSGNLAIGSTYALRFNTSGSASTKLLTLYSTGTGAGTRAELQIGSASTTSGDLTGSILFGCGASTTTANAPAIIYSELTASSTSVAYGALVFGTANGSQSAERMRISSTGIVTMNAYGVGTATFSAAGVISSVSDETWKIKDGIPVDPDSMLKKLDPGYWYYNDEKKETFGADRQLGFYAQNVNAAIGPEAAPEPEEGKPWGYYDRSVLAVTVMSLQKALATIETLTARITALEGA